jgi:hypothetical protein
VFSLAVIAVAEKVVAQTVSVSVNLNSVKAVMPATGIGLHTSVYANIFGAAALPSELTDSGVQLLRYPGGNYASIYHWTNHTATGGYAASASHFGNFVSRLMDGSGAGGMVTINYGSSHQATMGGQPKEAAAWVAYANGDAALYGTPADITIGVDDAGNDWRTVGYWARLRGMTPAENPDNQYDFLAINHDAPINIQYWEIGNEINGNGYYSDIDSNWNWQYDLHAPNPYGAGRGNHPALSPTAYANNFNEFAAAMKAVDPTIKVGAVLVGPGGVGDVADPTRNWDRNVLDIAGPNMDFGIIHWYVNNGTSTNTVLNATDDLPALFADVRNRIDTYVGSGQSQRIELHMTEFGYFGTVANEQINGVFAANTYATALADGVKSVHWLELSKPSFVGDNASQLVRGGAYYGIQLVSQIAQAGAEFVAATSSSGALEVQSTLLPDGRVGVLMANLNQSGTATINMTINGAAVGSSGVTWLYGQNQTTPLQTAMTTGLGNSFSMSVPFRSIVVLLIDPLLAGDYDRNGVVDAADYLLWRNTLNQAVALGSGADGDANGIVQEADYNIWRRNFGRSAGQAAQLPSVSVPEPATLGLALGAAILMLHRRRLATT